MQANLFLFFFSIPFVRAPSQTLQKAGSHTENLRFGIFALALGFCIANQFCACVLKIIQYALTSIVDCFLICFINNNFLLSI